MKDILVLGLGNDIVADDRFGAAVIEQLRSRRTVVEKVDALFVPLAGFALLDHLTARKSVLIVDAIVTGEAEPGTLHFFPSGHLTPTQHLCGSHQISLPTALQMGRMLGYEMPSKIDILASEAADVTTITEVMTPSVANSVEAAVLRTISWINLTLTEDSDVSELSRTGS